jgi:hypothetical protein
VSNPEARSLDAFVKALWGVNPEPTTLSPPQRKPRRCRIGRHKKRLRQGPVASRTFLLTGVNLYECERCDWRLSGIGEP